MSRALVFIATVAACLAVLATAPTVRAAGETATVIVISQPEPITVGASGQISVQLITSEGVALVDEPIALSLGDVTVGRRWTDGAGLVAFNVPRSLASGQYAVVAWYAGDSTYLPSSANAQLSVMPYELTVETVPPLAGMPFDLDGERFVSGEDGLARIPVGSIGEHKLTVQAGAYEDENRRAVFTRWGTEQFVPTITVQVPGQTRMQVGFDVLHRASQRFVDPQGASVDPGRVTSFTLRSNVGSVITYPDGQARWFTTSRTVRRPNGLHSVPVRYILERVDVDGQNVVNAGQQRFLAKPGDEWEVELLLFTVRLRPHDALFGFAVGDAVTLSYPNGESARIPTEDGALTARWLARGIYRISVPDAPGWSPITPVALSRDQEVQLRVVTYLDMAVVSLALLGLAVGLLHVGRPHLIPRAVGIAGNGLATLRDPRAAAALLSRRQPAPVTAAMGSPEASTATVGPPPGEFVVPHVRWPVHLLTGARAPSPASGQGAPLAAIVGSSALATPAIDTPDVTPRSALTPGRPLAGANSKAERGTRTRSNATPARASTTTPARASTVQPEAASGRKGSGARSKTEPTPVSAASRTEPKGRTNATPASEARVNGANGARVGSSAAPTTAARRSPPKRDAGNGEARRGQDTTREPSRKGRRTAREQADPSVRMRVAAVLEADRITTWLKAIGISQRASLPASGNGPAPEHASAEGPARARPPAADDVGDASGEPSCAGCGFILTNAARFCRRCGRALDQDRLLQDEGAA